MDMSLSKVPIFVLGSTGSLRNPRLEILGERITYIEPVFVGKDSVYRWSQILREIALNGRELTLGERGCALGHIKVRDAIIDSGAPWALVLEDDAELPEDWVQSLENKMRIVGDQPFSVLLLNTNPLLSFGGDPVELRVKPSGANAFLISRDCLKNRIYKSLEVYEIADWPISFSRDKFLSLSGLAEDRGKNSLVGKRPSSLTSFFVSSIIRFAFSPLISAYLRVSFSHYLSWSIFAPISRDWKLRFSQSSTHKVIGSGSKRQNTENEISLENLDKAP